VQLAVAYAVLEFQGQGEGACLDSYTWDLANPSEPDATLSPASALVCVCYNLKDHKARPE
jgi:dynein intermediate chain 2